MKTYQFADQEIIDIAKSEEVFLLPTETVYGIGVRWDSQTGYEKLVKAKNRRPDKPIAVMVGTKFNLEEWAYLSDPIRRVIQEFLPGPLTVLVKAKENVPYQATLGSGVMGVRIPGSQTLLSFLNQVNVPLQVTSANISGEPATSDYESAKAVFESNVDVRGIIQGECSSKVPTTVVDLTGEEPKLVRAGEIKIADIEKVWKGK